MKEKVNTFVVGAGKAGTSWLQECFSEHPEIFVSTIKEHNYFSAYHKGPIEKYLQKFKGSEDFKIVSDISPTYMTMKGTAQRLFSYNPEANIIFLLRNPVERAYSDYCMLLKGGSVSKEVYKEILNKNSAFHSRLFYTGVYIEHIKNYLNYFPRKNIQIFFYDDLKNDAEQFIKTIFKGLQVDHGFVPEIINKKVHTAKFLPKNQGLYNTGVKIFRNTYNAFPFLRSSLTLLRKNGVADMVNKMNNGGGYPKLATNEKKVLLDSYMESIVELENFTGRDLSSWKSN